MSNYERTGHSSKGYRSVLQTPTLRPINIPPLTNMEATGRLAMTGHSTLVIVSTRLTAIGALTNHVRTVVEESEREVPASSDRRKFPPDILELIRAKALSRERISHSRVQIQSASSPTRSESSRSGIRNESWSDLMEEIKPSHKAVTKALKTEGYTPIPPLKKPDNSVAIDDAEIAECLADSIETQCSHASLRTTSLISVASRKRFSKNFPEPTIWLPSHSAKSKRYPFFPQQVLRLVEYVSEGFETERSTVAVFFDVAKAFDRQTDISHLGMSALTRQDVLSEQEFLKAPPSAVPAYTNDTATVVVWRPTRRAIDELGQWFRKEDSNPDKSAAIQFKTVMTYASPVFAHAAPKALHRLQGLRTPHYFQIYEGRIEAILRHRGITSQCVYARRLTINRRIPPTLSVGHETVGLSVSQVIDLSSLLHPAAARLRQERKEPTRDGFLRHSMPTTPGVVHSACHAPSALACAVRPHSVKLSKSSDLSSDSSRPTK
ncbi:hypothetical protein EVAR_20697_1 [Eumeta japonica]|uniref:Uncharacterized protein n=1 Tax=Eumeta variegata TaxID=151549 RepID=A0A4C1VBJ9_EUMVA|nr:hypothetical protein EVAR_20697_1 [Eumeta japonica]